MLAHYTCQLYNYSHTNEKGTGGFQFGTGIF